jgi:methylphosphotriester-DNA--protein-cysteine methyltransferase
MKSLPIIWQRLVSSEGRTCDRCNATNLEMQQAISKLKEALRPLGIEPTLETREIDEESFKANPSESNRIYRGQAHGRMAWCKGRQQSLLFCLW